MVSLADLIRAEGNENMSSVIDAATPTVAPEDDLPEVARLMSDFNLIAMPVLDHDRRPVGLIAVDDVLEELVPDEWRRRVGIARD